jgi:hypothetical protein
MRSEDKPSLCSYTCTSFMTSVQVSFTGLLLATIRKRGSPRVFVCLHLNNRQSENQYDDVGSRYGARGDGKPHLHNVIFVILRCIFLNNYKLNIPEIFFLSFFLSFFHINIFVNIFLKTFFSKTNFFNIFDKKIFNNFMTLCVRHVRKNRQIQKTHKYLRILKGSDVGV